MKYKLQYLPIARKDIERAVDYLVFELGAIEAAEGFVLAVDQAASSLVEMPYRYPLYPVMYGMREEVRSVPVANYTLFYQVIEASKTVEVLRVLHQRQETKARL